MNSPQVLCSSFMLKNFNNIYISGQLCGVEGYVESAASGLMAAINVYMRISGRQQIDFTTQTVMGALANYITAENKNFQPMNANFGILKPLDVKIKDKLQRNALFAQRSLNKIKELRCDI
ncbi:MAG: FAD-dependent oxidoreductase [Clostridia bacterium]|nr:FAD-dependent oxidoreductase [Clostridia bacterium]